MESEAVSIKTANPRSVYVHVPFCLQRCGYCDFSILAGRDDLIPRYLESLDLEISRSLEHLIQPPVLDTLFVGGGTPTLLSRSELEKLFSILFKHFRLEPDAEFSVEANPDGLTDERQQVLAQFGVNRISLGVQSFDAEVLKRLDRKHTPENVIEIFEQLSKMIPNISLDLIYGVPGQSFESWQETLHQAIALDPAHISMYALTFEKGTAFWTQRSKGQLIQVEDSLEVRMYQWAIEQLKSRGYSQYEISNFSKPSMESRHNCAYWLGQSYWAYGPGASRFVDGVRSTNHRSSFTWMKRIEAGDSPVDIFDELNTEQRARELIAIGLRYLPGVEKSRIEEQTGHRIEILLGKELVNLKERGWIEETKLCIRLTSEGKLFADAVACEVI
ncbi:MAG: radical SAM family heme chaperone HemW [Planctomycetaceae bacterium]|nr:radical SAM family heme chaperone HemW [Planctomycetaceae bacterium]